MTTTFSVETEDRDLQDRLDQLIPPPAGPVRKLIAGIVLLAFAVGFTALNLGGYLYPRPIVGGNFESASIIDLNTVQKTMESEVILPNLRSRTVRITGVSLDAPGAELVEVGVRIEPRPTAVDGSLSSSAAEPAKVEGTFLGETVGLPVEVEPGETAVIRLHFRPVDCIDRPVPWGIAEITVDFGAGAFPPVSRTIRNDQDPVWAAPPMENGQQVAPSMGMVLLDHEIVEGSGPLAIACKVLR